MIPWLRIAAALFDVGCELRNKSCEPSPSLIEASDVEAEDDLRRLDASSGVPQKAPFMQVLLKARH